MRSLPCVVLFILLPLYNIIAQTSLQEINLQNGTYAVGFRHYTAIDSSRTYRIHNEFNNQAIYRPIPISIWYPATVRDGDQPLKVLNYLEVLKEEEEWHHLPNAFLLDWFSFLWNTPENEAHLSETVTAFSAPHFAAGRYPVIVYAPSYQASSIENFALCEYLASHGYVVVSSPSRGTKTRWLEGATRRDMETQSRDVEFLLRELLRYSNIDDHKIALMGFSFGGLSNAVTAMKNDRICALISLDGTERYRYE
ncbi:MAG: prolyl oligopeptidase family serine peptidase, partial [Bacteroidota bacterium]